MSDLFSKVGIDLGVVVLLLIVLIIVMMIMTVSMSLRLKSCFISGSRKLTN